MRRLNEAQAYLDNLFRRRAAQTEAAYGVEEEFLEGWMADRGDGGEGDRLAAEEIGPFIDSTLVRERVAGRPEVRLVEHDDRSGWVRDDVIHLDPRFLSRRLVLHELAHWLSPEGHGPDWAAVYVHLLGQEYGDDVGAMMRDALLRAVAI